MIGSLLSIISLSHAVRVKMPSGGQISDRLKDEGLIEFAQVTEIATKLANQKFQAVGLANSIAAYMQDYKDYIAQSYSEDNAVILLAQFSIMQSKIYRAIFKDYPEALEELKGFGLYKPNDEK